MQVNSSNGSLQQRIFSGTGSIGGVHLLDFNDKYVFSKRKRRRDMERPHFDIVASGERMRQIRRQRNISVKQVMEYMGFESTQAVYKWEAGKCYPQADNLVALAILYHVSPMELLVEEDLVSSSTCLGYSIAA